MRNHVALIAFLGLTMSVAGCADPGGDDEHEVVSSASQAVTETCVTIQRGSLGDVADARLRADAPDTNYGARDTFVTGNQHTDRLALVRYDLSPIPAGNVITSATATLSEVSNQGASTVNVHRATAAWDESTVTLNSFGNAYNPAVETSFSNGGAGHTGDVSFDLTALVQGWYDGSMANHGIAMSATTNSTWSASERAAASERPSIEVCYGPPPVQPVYTNLGLIGGQSGSAGTRLCPNNQGITSLGNVTASWYEVGSVSPSCGTMTQNGPDMSIDPGATLASYGSNQTGGQWGSGQVTCPAGTIATGVTVRHDFVYIYGFQLRCHTLDAAGNATGALQTSSFVGQGGLGTQTTADCPAGNVLAGMNMWDTLYGFYGVQPICATAIGL